MRSLIVKDLSKWIYDRLVDLWIEAGLPFKPQGRDSFLALSNRLETTPTWLVLLVDERDDPFEMQLQHPLVGAVIITHDGQRGWINRLAIHPRYRGKGYAKRLIELSEQFLRSQNISLFAALIESDNKPSLSLFSSLGYVVHEDIKYLSKRDSSDY